jgi:FkbM family methyltransferase
MLFDIGCNRGNYTNSNIHKYDKVVCVDASELQCEICKANVPSEKCTVVHSLVSSVNEAKFYRCSASGISTASLEWIMGKGRFAPGNRWWEPTFQWALEPVSVISLDRLVEIYGVPSFIKIDVEGHELEAIKSLTKYSGPMAFEWSEEMKTEAIETINYIHDVLGHEKYHIQNEDAYTYVPDENSYISRDEIIEVIEKSWTPTRQELWGMIWCK